MNREIEMTSVAAKQPEDVNMQIADRYLARYIRERLIQLRAAITDAREAGLTVEVPELVHLYLDGGTASGSPSDWKISRGH